MTTMDFCPSDLDQVSSNFLDMIENDINGQLMDIENFNSDKLGDFVFNHEQSQDNVSSSQFDFEQDSDLNNINFFQNLAWNDISKIPQSLIDASSEIENNNPNLLVNPQSVLPVHSTGQPVSSSTQHVSQVNVHSGLPIRINGQDAILTPTQHPQIQYVTVQNTGTDSLNNTRLGYTVQPVSLATQVHSLQTTLSSSPSQSSPVLVEHLQNGIHAKVSSAKLRPDSKVEKVYPKPVYSYSCLIAMALKNSKTGNLPVSEIYTFMIENFPYFKTAPDGWKNSVRHNLSLNKCFAKVETAKTGNAHTRKGCLWALNPAKIEKMEEEIVKWRKKDPESVKYSMAKPENLELIEQGKAGPPKDYTSTPNTPVKQEAIQVGTPVKQQQILTPTASSPLKMIIPRQQEVAVIVKTEPELSIVQLKEDRGLNSGPGLDPALSDLALNNGLWDDELNSELSISMASAMPQTTDTLLTLPSNIGGGGGSHYHGNITYATSPLTTRSPLANTTPTKLYPQTPSKLYQSQTPTRIVIA